MTMHFLWGALTVLCFVAGLFFLKYWRQSRESLFVALACSFWLLGLNWLALAILDVQDETRHYLYVLRLVAFLLLIVGIAGPNRRK
jgi:hypothetical protein